MNDIEPISSLTAVQNAAHTAVVVVVVVAVPVAAASAPHPPEHGLAQILVLPAVDQWVDGRFAKVEHADELMKKERKQSFSILRKYDSKSGWESRCCYIMFMSLQEK